MVFASINDLEAFAGRPLTPAEIVIGTAMLESATVTIREWLGRHVTAQTFVDAPAVPVGSVIVLPDFPVADLTIVEQGRTLVEGDHWRLEPRGVVRRVSQHGVPMGWRGPLTVSGTVGTDPAPAWAVTACLFTAWVSMSEDIRDGVGPVVSEKTVDHSVTWADPTSGVGSALGGQAQGGLPAAAQSILAPHRRGDGLAPTVHTLTTGGV